jgi:polygalacturonase
MQLLLSKKAVKLGVVAAFILMHLTSITYARLITYPAPKVNFRSNAYTVKVSETGRKWQSIDLYYANVAHTIGTHTTAEKTTFGYFDCDGKVNVEITVSGRAALKTVKIRPEVFHIQPVVKGNKITFSMHSNQNLSVEVDGNVFDNLQIFANEIDPVVPSKRDTSVLYFGPGVHHIGQVILPSGKKVYIAGGAVVEGSFRVDHAENIRISGHGILTQFGNPEEPSGQKSLTRPVGKGRNDDIIIDFSRNVTVDGLIVLPHKYSVLIGSSKNVNVSNMKSFSSEGNADGIDIFCSEDITLRHIFMRNADDCIAIYGHRWGYYGNTRRVKVEDAVLWANVAHPVLIGTHGDTVHPDTLEKMHFTNVAILGQHENQLDYQGCLALNAGDSNLIRDIVFENVTIDSVSKGQLFNLRVMFNHKYNTSPGGGVQDVLFKNVTFEGTCAPLSIIAGYDDARNIKNITFENLRIGGTIITDDMPAKPGFYKTGDMANIFIGEHVEDLKFIP